MRYISFSLFGQDRDYLVGAVINARLAASIYPSWKPVFFLGPEVDLALRAELESMGCLVVTGKKSISSNPRVWRFSAGLFPDAEYVIFRDTDSRVSAREALAVEDWMRSGRALHIIRDHPHHFYPIMAGMWGLRSSPYSKALIRSVLSAAKGDDKPEDQRLLAEIIYPSLVNDSFVHDTFYRREPHSVPLSERDSSNSFIGERISASGTPDAKHRLLISKYEKSRFGAKRLRTLDGFREWVFRTFRLQMYFLLKTGTTEK